MPTHTPDGLKSHAQLARLFRIVLHLQLGHYPRAEALAELCGVSRRTAYRDLETLVQAGVPVRYRADRMGYELDGSFRMEPPPLTDEELHSLVLHVVVPDGEIPSELTTLALHGLQKIVTAPRPAVARGGRRLVNAVRDGRQRGAENVRASCVFTTILGALSRQRQVRLRYLDSDVCTAGAGTAAGGEPIQTRVHPFQLIRGRIGWSLFGRSTYHKREYEFVIRKIVSIVELGETAEQPARVHLRSPRIVDGVNGDLGPAGVCPPRALDD